MRPGRGRRLGTLAVAYGLIVVSCGDPTSPGGREVDRVVVNPQAVAITVGETRAITAQVFDTNDERVLDRRVLWTTQNSTVASVSQSGVITGVGSGNTQIAASAGGKSGLVAVSVNARPVSLVRVVPATASVQVGRTTPLAAEALDASGAEVIGRPVTWASNRTTVATVSDDGIVTGVVPGSAAITATVDGINGTGNVTVSAVPAAAVTISPDVGSVLQGGALQLTATARDAQGNALTGRTAAWSSSDESIATVSSTGRVVGIAEGPFTITATIDGVTGTGSYTVTRIPVGLLTVSPATATIAIGQTQPLTVSLFAADKTTPLPTAGRTVAWSSSNPAVVTVTASGVVSGVAAGLATITATTEGISGTATVSVTALPIASISVAPSPVTVAEGSTVTLVATARDANNVVLLGRTFFWASNNPQVSVSQTGVVTAVANSATQTATITASAPSGGPGGSTPSGTAAVSVTFAPVAAVILAPPALTINVSQTISFATILQAAGGQSLAATGRTISWQSLDSAIVSVNAATGVMTGVLQGGPVGIKVSASSPGQLVAAVDTGFVTVSNVPVATVTVTPGPTTTVHVGSLYARTFTAEPRDGSGNVLSGRPVTWISLAPNHATVDPLTGVVTGITTGTNMIRATIEGVNGTSSVTVDLVSVASVVVSPATATLNLISQPTVTLTAAARDSANNAIIGLALGGRTPTWDSSDDNVATVAATGVVTAHSPGNATISATIGGSPPGTSAISVPSPVSSVTFTAQGDSLILPGSVAAQVAVSATPATGRVVTLSSAPTGIVTPTPTPGTTDASGQVAVTLTGVAPGSATITATSEGQSDIVVLQVLAGISSIALTPANADSIIGTGTLNLTATAVGSNAAALQGRPLTISSGTPAVATLSTLPTANTDAAGQIAITLTGVAPGNTLLTVASAEGKSATRTIRVLAPASSVDVLPATSAMIEGDLQVFGETVKDAVGNTLPGRAVTWSSSSASKLVVDPVTGSATATDSGAVTVTATVIGTTITGTASVTITLLPVTTVTITPASVTVPILTNSTTLTVEAQRLGGPARGRACTAQSSDPSLATVTPSGTTGQDGKFTVTVDQTLFLLPGVVTITATCEGIQGTSVVTFQ